MHALRLWSLLIGISAYVNATEPIRLHPDNPHYFLWRGKPTVLITSGEHYGAVLNLDFDYVKYLDTLARDGLNLTRTFTGGAYVELPGTFNIEGNTLAPASGRFISPWARSDVPGYAGGGNKFDLSRWNEDYFSRLRDFVAKAAERGIVVEINLFCPMYEDRLWEMSPFHIDNNVNGLGRIARHELYTLDRHGGLLEVQERMVRRIVAELGPFDNVYYEVTNEPYAGKVPLNWEHHIVDLIAEMQRDRPRPQLVSMNIANYAAEVPQPHPAVSIFNFHYATPPDTVRMNYRLQRVIGDNETGFRGTEDSPYRGEAWDFIVAGGGLFNHLDYSFAVGYEDGTFVYPATQPGGGNPGFRRQLKILGDWIRKFDFIHMQPDDTVIVSGSPDSGTARALSHAGSAYAVYLRRTSASGPFSIRWTGYVVAPKTGDFIFSTLTNDGARLWIDDQLLIDRWIEQSATDHHATIALRAGQMYRVKFEYFYNGGQGIATLSWSGPSMEKEPIPSEYLRLPDKSGPGLKGEYFRGNNFQQAWVTRNDGRIDFPFGTESPLPPPSLPQDAQNKELILNVPAGAYQLEWLEPATGRIIDRRQVTHDSGKLVLHVPEFREDIALSIRK